MNRVTDIPDSLLISFYISRLKLNLQHELLVSRPTTLGDAFSLTRIIEARFEAITEKEQNIKEKADTTLSLPSEEVSPVVKGPLDVSQDTLLSLRRPVHEVSSMIEDVFDIDESNVEGMQVRDEFVEFFKDRGSMEKMMLCLIENRQNHEKIYCSSIYAANTGMERRILWKDLQVAKCITNVHAWVLIGDFNVTLKLEEHFSSSSIISCDMQEFIDCVNLINVEDICMTGMYYTWIKSPSNPSTSILKKLDRVMANEDFFNKYNQAFVVFHPFMTSDHSPAILTIPHAMTKKRKSFKVTKKLKLLKKHIKKLQWINGDIFTRVENLRSKLKEVQSDVNKFPYDSKKKELVVTLEEFNEALNEEEKFLSQKAKVDWLCEESIDGSKIADEFVKHFENFLGQGTPVQHLDSLDNIFTNTLTTEEASAMVNDVSDQEIKTTMFSIDDCKAPVPDGYIACLFKKAWLVIGNDVCLAIKEFFKSENLLKVVNSTLIALIPKVHHPKPSAFIQGRNIQDNILLTQELLKGYNRKGGSKICALKIDIAKAYDTLS
ncbi:RNA-directed DNA polymerase, eukaryota, reverse transcriptase zinc-binding domain protein [Tanacetum coccineum]